MWEYNIRSHTLKHDGTIVTADAYAGSPEAKNDPAKVSIRDQGPLPPGDYIIEAPRHSHHTGPYTLNLEPTPGNIMYGRNNFRIHGDSTRHPGAASNGCIIVGIQFRQLIWNSGDHLLRVTQ